MSTIALRAPRVFRLPRVKFKRPRWPKGSRYWLAVTVPVDVFFLCVLWIGFTTLDVVAGAWSWVASSFYGLSRSDDDGPSAT